MNKYRDQIWKEMAKVRNEHSIEVKNQRRDIEENFISEGDYFYDPITNEPL
jgi:hypothetical protein